jgi:hypothetical protein
MISTAIQRRDLLTPNTTILVPKNGEKIYIPKNHIAEFDLIQSKVRVSLPQLVMFEEDDTLQRFLEVLSPLI